MYETGQLILTIVTIVLAITGPVILFACCLIETD